MQSTAALKRFVPAQGFKTPAGEQARKARQQQDDAPAAGAGQPWLQDQAKRQSAQKLAPKGEAKRWRYLGAGHVPSLTKVRRSHFRRRKALGFDSARGLNQRPLPNDTAPQSALANRVTCPAALNSINAGNGTMRRGKYQTWMMPPWQTSYSSYLPAALSTWALVMHGNTRWSRIALSIWRLLGAGHSAAYNIGAAVLSSIVNATAATSRLWRSLRIKCCGMSQTMPRAYYGLAAPPNQCHHALVAAAVATGFESPFHVGAQAPWPTVGAFFCARCDVYGGICVGGRKACRCLHAGLSTRVYPVTFLA